MNIIFDKSFKQRMYQLIRSKVNDPRCPFCFKEITGKNFAGAAWIDGQFRMFDGSFLCLIEYADKLKDET